MEIKRDVRFFFLKTKSKLAGKIVPNGGGRCLSTKQKSPVVTLKNFQKCAKIEGTFSHARALFSCGLNEAFCSNSEQINVVMAVATRRQTSKLWLVKWNLMLNEPIRSKITTNRDLFVHVCPCFVSPNRIFRWHLIGSFDCQLLLWLATDIIGT